VSLQDLEENVAAAHHGHPEAKARGVDGGVVRHGSILSKAMMGLAEGDTWAAPGNAASVNGGEELDESVVPWTGTRWGRSGDRLWLIDDGLDAVDPVAYVIGRRSTSRCDRSLSSHYETGSSV